MRHITIALSVLIPISVCAVDYPLTYGKYSLHPAGWVEGKITSQQRADLNSCKSTAKANTANKELLTQIYGLNSADYYGVLLIGCLSDEKHGKGWVVLKTDGGKPKRVTSRSASRSLMGLNSAR